MFFYTKSFPSRLSSSRTSSSDPSVRAPLLLPPLDNLSSPKSLFSTPSCFFAATKSCIKRSILNCTSTFLLTNPSPSDPLNRSTSSYYSVSDPPMPFPFSIATTSLISSRACSWHAWTVSWWSWPSSGGAAWLLSISDISLDNNYFWCLSSISLTSVLVFFSWGMIITSPFLSSICM